MRVDDSYGKAIHRGVFYAHAQTAFRESRFIPKQKPLGKSNDHPVDDIIFVRAKVARALKKNHARLAYLEKKIEALEDANKDIDQDVLEQERAELGILKQNVSQNMADEKKKSENQ